MNKQNLCNCQRLLKNDSSTEESSSSESEWDSINVQSSSLNELPPQSGIETPEMMQLTEQFDQLSCKDSEEQQEQPQSQIEPIAEDIMEPVVVEENPNANPDLDIPLEQVNSSPVITPEEVEPQEDVNQTPSIPEEQVNTSSEEEVPMENVGENSQPSVEDEKDGNYFLQILREEQTRLLDMAGTADTYVASLNTRTSRYEYALEKLRHFSGLAKLLVSSKMKQFEELCFTNVKNSSDCLFPVTNNDLHGFWDMIYQQVPPLDADFAEILKLKDNNWVAPRPETPPGSSNNSASTGGQRALKRKVTAAKTTERVWRR